MTMPDPARLARQSVRLSQRAGLDQPAAAELVIQVCDLAAGYLRRGSQPVSLTWLAQIRAEARRIRDSH